jgi:serine/threonine protein kinase
MLSERVTCCCVLRFGQIEILRRVGHHEFIVCMLDAFETPEHVEIVMELMEGGELYGRIASKGPYAEGTAALICRRLASAVRYLHRHGVVHRDLKPENLLLASEDKDDVVKVRVLFTSPRAASEHHILLAGFPPGFSCARACAARAAC